MKMRKTHSGIALLVLVFGAGTSIAEAPLNTRSYQCQELKALVAQRDRVVLKGFLGSQSTVYASASSCHYEHETPFKSAWKTKDVLSCVVGYRCRSRLGVDGFGDD